MAIVVSMENEYVAPGGTLTYEGMTLFRDVIEAAEATPAAGSLDGLSDVTITTPATGHALVYNGSGWVNGAPSVAWTTGATDNANSGATVTYSGSIPSTVTEIRISVLGLSLNGAGDVLVRFLESGTPKATGYLGWGHFDFSVARDATGFRIRIGAAARVISGDLILRLDTSTNRWRCDGFLVETSAGASILETHGWVDSVTGLSGFNLVTTAGSFDGSGTVQAFWR